MRLFRVRRDRRSPVTAPGRTEREEDMTNWRGYLDPRQIVLCEDLLSEIRDADVATGSGRTSRRSYTRLHQLEHEIRELEREILQAAIRPIPKAI